MYWWLSAEFIVLWLIRQYAVSQIDNSGWCAERPPIARKPRVSSYLNFVLATEQALRHMHVLLLSSALRYITTNILRDIRIQDLATDSTGQQKT